MIGVLFYAIFQCNARLLTARRGEFVGRNQLAEAGSDKYRPIRAVARGLRQGLLDDRIGRRKLLPVNENARSTALIIARSSGSGPLLMVGSMAKTVAEADVQRRGRAP